MFLVLAHSNDNTALAVYRELCARHGQARTALLTDEDLVSGVGWTHLQHGLVSQTVLHLRDGRRVSCDEISAVFNRLRYLNVAHFTTLAGVDREYALGEMSALVLSWLADLKCAVINPPSTLSLNGEHRSLFEWLRLAVDVGLPTRNAHFATNARLISPKNYSAFQPLAGARLTQAVFFTPVQSTLVGQAPMLMLENINAETQKLLVIGERVFGELQELSSQCLALARRSNTKLLECVFVRSVVRQEKVWRCGWVNSFPELNYEEVAAVVSLLEAKPSP